jgi:hypothetical protein
MHRRRIPEAAVHQVVEDADRIIERQDGRTEYFGEWDGLRILVVTIGEGDPRFVINVIEVEQRRRRRRR